MGRDEHIMPGVLRNIVALTLLGLASACGSDTPTGTRNSDVDLELMTAEGRVLPALVGTVTESSEVCSLRVDDGHMSISHGDFVLDLRGAVVCSAISARIYSLRMWGSAQRTSSGYLLRVTSEGSEFELEPEAIGDGEHLRVVAVLFGNLVTLALRSGQAT